MRKSKTFKHKRVSVIVDVELNTIKTAGTDDSTPKHSINVRVPKYKFDYPATVSDLRLQDEINKGIASARAYIDEMKRRDALPKTADKDIEKKHLAMLSEKGFK